MGIESGVKKARVDDISIAFKEMGSGEPLVLINGFGSTMDMWNPPVLKALAKRFKVVVFDNRGMGYTTSSDKEYSIELLAQDAMGLMDKLKIKKAHILGVSMGSFVAQELAVEHPERVDKLILVSGHCGGKKAIKTPPEIWKRLADKGGSLEERAERMFKLLFPTSWLKTHDPLKYCPEVYEPANEANIARQEKAIKKWRGAYSRLAEIKSQTLIISGDMDIIIHPGNSKILEERIPDARVVSLKGGGHGLMYQFPTEFCEAVAGFLSV